MALKAWLFFLGFMDLCAVTVVTSLVPIYLKAAGHSPSVIGLYSSVYGFLQLFASPVIGHWADTHGRANVLFVCLVISACSYGVSSVVIDIGFLLLLVRIVLGIFKHTQDLCRGFLAEVGDESERTSSASRYNSAASIGAILGPTISGYITEKAGLGVSVTINFIICAILFLVNATMVHIILKPLARKKLLLPTDNKFDTSAKVYTSQFSLIREGIKAVNWKVHGGMFFSRFLLALAVMMYRSSFVLGLKYYYPSLTSLQIGYLLSCNALMGSLVGFASSFIFSHQIYRKKEEKLQIHAILFVSLGMIIMAMSTSIASLLVGLSALSVGTSTSRACGISLTIKRCGVDKAGTFLGLNASVISIARSIAPLATGIIQEYSYAVPAYASFVLSLCSLCMFYFFVYLRPIKPN